jgi:hypothetical protein
MGTRRLQWAASVLAALGLPALASAEDVVWRAARTPTPAVASTSAPDRGPAATLGRPVPIASSSPGVAQARPVSVQASNPLVVGRAGSVARAQAPDSDAPSPWPPPPPPASVVDDVKPPSAKSDVKPPSGKSDVGRPDLPDLNMKPSKHDVWQPADPPPPDVHPSIITDQPVGPSWGEKMLGWLEWGDRGSINGRAGLQSDHCFDGAVSPITAPFYFEDPRALTEVRPIFMYQGVPSKSAGWNGGDLFFFGTQARLALSERFSIVLHELGFYSFNPNTPAPPIRDGTGFAEVKLGAKYTFLRNAERNSAAAVGVMFEIPAGSDKVLQSTGDLSITPYLSYSQTLCRLPGGYGSLNVMGNMGYSFSIDNTRSEFFYTNLHLDYNVAGLNKIFPLIETNWIYYTKSGTATNLGYEGADLINFGSATREGKNYLSLAAGLRYKFTENIIAGAAVQFPVSQEKGLQDYRLTFDLIFRY